MQSAYEWCDMSYKIMELQNTGTTYLIKLIY
jgi:hypothetical protein